MRVIQVLQKINEELETATEQAQTLDLNDETVFKNVLKDWAKSSIDKIS